ncbi:ABC transporter ATP-binding protein [uncultured Acetatifactor sp.]|jgi:ATP-binding cassette subfamily B protein|uniref:ABC transporter ATP-binding protein n=1 Tax=uncultured Acetatifactor sp. TaxID=1671927 RepID=UPI00261960CA|nr:ABC transporter ATP-binding protein [uncultured Acetatifactor sp.]
MRYIKDVLKKNRKWVVAYLTIGLFNAFMSNYKADCFQRIVDGLTDRTITFYGILFYGGVLFVTFGMNYVDVYPTVKLDNDIYLDFKLLALQKIGRMDYAEYQKLGTGKLIQQIENGAKAGKGVLYDFWFEVVRNLVPTILFSLFFIWKIDPKITCFLLAGYVIVFIVTNLLLRGLYQIKERILTNEEELNHFLVRGFMEMPLFRMKRQFPGEVRKALGAKRTIVAAKVKMSMIHEAFFTIFALLVACLDIGILVYAWKGGHLTVGAVVALIALIDNAYVPIAIFNVIYVQYKLNLTAWHRFAEVLDLKEDVQLSEGAAFDTLAREIRVEELSLSYGGAPGEGRRAVDSVSLIVRKGEKVAFVGESGSGKSTLAKALVGLLKYEEGDILYDGEPLRNLSLESLYGKASYLSQDTPVFDGTIRENLVFDREVPDEDMRAAMERVQLLPLLSSLDKGMDTRIGEKGACLSGGEKQRLALARLLLDRPEIVVLDEATSALDNVTESIVMKNVLEQAKDATVISIAHRLSSIRGFDHIFVFKEGRIVGSGTFEELLAGNSYFAQLYRKEKERGHGD